MPHTGILQDGHSQDLVWLPSFQAKASGFLRAQDLLPCGSKYFLSSHIVQSLLVPRYSFLSSSASIPTLIKCHLFAQLSKGLRVLLKSLLIHFQNGSGSCQSFSSKELQHIKIKTTYIQVNQLFLMY